MNSKPIIAPSVLSADFAYLGRDIDMINNSQADWFHVDIMDGLFVPNMSFGFPVMESLKKHAQKPLDVHLMIMDPDRYVARFVECGAEIISVHAEACTHLHRSVQNIRNLGVKAGIALNPHTPISILENLGGCFDLVVIMSVNPGFGGQKFIENTYRKTEMLAEWRTKNNLNFMIEIDGGVNSGNAKSLVQAGADILVAGNFVFSSPNPSETIQELKNLF
jgi:ribulose-phosphate 3-epimerase